MNHPLPILDDGSAVKQFAPLSRPRTSRQLHAYIKHVLGFNIPRQAIVAGHDAPFEYVEHAFFEHRAPGARDCLVWANRGGGKTQIGAIVTLLDLLFKPGIQIRILGGSLEQSSKMYAYLKAMLETERFNRFIAGRLTGRHVELVNGSRAEVLSQSECAVRGQRVHKMRCDEVELFDPEIWEAAQLVTRSGRCGSIHVTGCVEAFSTMHRPYGMMQKLVRDAAAARRRIFRWSLLDTLEHCPTWRRCESDDSAAACPLWDECQGRAKLSPARGFVMIDDAIQQKRRVGAQTWASEMLCEQPNRSDCVYPEFDVRVHVFDEQVSRAPDTCLIAGIDFGYRGDTVVLWAIVDSDNVVHVIDELSINEHVSARIIELADERCIGLGLGKVAWIGADPAGRQRNDQTGISNIGLWRRAGWPVRTRCTRIEEGIATVRARLRRADGSIGLRIHQRCQKLIEALRMYHYPASQPEALTPVKEGHDHAADALRYMIVNLDRGNWELNRRGY